MEADPKVVTALKTLALEVARLTGNLNSLGRAPQKESPEATWDFKVPMQIGSTLDCLTNPDCPRYVAYQRALGVGNPARKSSEVADEITAEAIEFDTKLRQFGAALDDFRRKSVEAWGDELLSLEIWMIIPALIEEGREFTSTLHALVEELKPKRQRKKAKASPKRRPVVKIQAKRR